MDCYPKQHKNKIHILIWVCLFLSVLAPFFIIPETYSQVLSEDEQKEKAREAFKKGKTAYDAKNFKEAIEWFEKANEIQPNEQLLKYISICYEQQSLFEQAIQYLVIYSQISSETEAEVADKIERLRNQLVLLTISMAKNRVFSSFMVAVGTKSEVVETDVFVPKMKDVGVTILSTPPKADVYIDEREWGVMGKTPFEARIFEGKHTLIVEKEFYKPQYLEIFVKPFEEVVEAPVYNFTLDRDVVNVEVTAKPSDSEIILLTQDGDRRDLGSGYFKGELPAGPVKFIIKKVRWGQGSFDATISQKLVDEEGILRLDFEIERESDEGKPSVVVGTLKIESVILGATVTVDGVEIGDTPGILEQKTAPGPHVVQVYKEGFFTWEQSVEITTGDTTHVETPGFLVEEAKPNAFAWTFLGIGLVVGVAGGTVGVLASFDRDEFEDCQKDITCTVGKGKDIKDSHETKALVADILFSASATMILTSVVLFIIESYSDGPSAQDNTLDMGVVPISGGGLLTVEFAF